MWLAHADYAQGAQVAFAVLLAVDLIPYSLPGKVPCPTGLGAKGRDRQAEIVFPVLHGCIGLVAFATTDPPRCV